MPNFPYYLLEVWSNGDFLLKPEQYLYSSKDDAEKDGEKKIERTYGGVYKIKPIKVRYKSYGRN